MKSTDIDAKTLYGRSMSQVLLYDEIEIWHGHPDLFMNELEELLKNLVDNDVGFLLEVDLKSLYNIKQKLKKLPFDPEKRFSLQNNLIK